jgi:hypothetical protein
LVTGPPGPCGCGCALSPATSKGFSAAAFARDVLGIELIPWQRWLLIHALELRPDGRFRYRTILVLVGRQNGKTSVVEIKNLWKMYVLRVQLVIGTAQNLDISEESWDKAVDLAESIPELAAEIEHVDRTNGKKALRLAKQPGETQRGPRWKIAAASRKGGRGLAGDDVNLDELREHQTWDSWAAVTKTTLARRNSQVWAYSNAGDDKSVVLNDLQEKGRATVGVPDPNGTLGHFEWSVPDDVKCDCNLKPHAPDCQLRDRTLQAMANPSYGYMIDAEALDSALETDPEPIFRTECLCQHVPSLVVVPWQVIGRTEWEAAADVADTVTAPVAFGLEVEWDRSAAAFGVAWRRPGGLRQIELTQSDDGVDHRPGTGWCVARAKELLARNPGSVLAFDPGGPAGSLRKDFEDAGVPFTPMSMADAGRAYGDFYDAFTGADLTKRDGRHGNQPALNTAVQGAVERTLGDARAWDRRNSTAFCPLGAATAALWALRHTVPLRSKVY